MTARIKITAPIERATVPISRRRNHPAKAPGILSIRRSADAESQASRHATFASEISSRILAHKFYRPLRGDRGDEGGPEFDGSGRCAIGTRSDSFRQKNEQHDTRSWPRALATKSPSFVVDPRGVARFSHRLRPRFCVTFRQRARDKFSRPCAPQTGAINPGARHRSWRLRCIRLFLYRDDARCQAALSRRSPQARSND